VFQRATTTHGAPRRAQPEIKAQLCVLGDASDYKYIRGTTDVDSIDDAKDFAECEKAFGDLEFPDSERIGR
jgi:myosin heavy subunit